MFPKLFVTDLDGTALGGEYLPYSRFPDQFSAFLDYLSDNGCAWAINSAWTLNGQWELVKVSSVKSKPAFYMAEIGMILATHTEKGPEFVKSYADSGTLNIKCATGQLDVRPGFINKGTSLAAAIEMMGISPDDVIVAGDEITDIAMMQPELAKYAICPENAEVEVKKHVQALKGGVVGPGYASKGIIPAFKTLFGV